MILSILLKREIHASISHLMRGSSKGQNAGIGKQLKLLDIQRDVPDDIADFESDLMDVDMSKKEYKDETKARRSLIRHEIVKHKYFRKKMYNFLLFSEKEQMRALHEGDPEEWTIEKLAASFPATVDVVAKVLRANWRVDSVERVRRHDEAVMRNWQRFQTADDFPEMSLELKQHLAKFTNRIHADLTQKMHEVQKWQLRPELPRPTNTEFLSLVLPTGNKIPKEESTPESNKFHRLAAGKMNQKKPLSRTEAAASAKGEETYLLGKVYDKRNMRLQELRAKKLNAIDLSVSRGELPSTENVERKKDEDTEDSITITDTVKGGNNLQTPNKFHSAGASGCSLLEKYQTTEIVVSKEDQKRYEMTTVKDRIYIPRKLYKAGGTYKVHDCYYDDDGQFLYRVPGMSGKV